MKHLNNKYKKIMFNLKNDGFSCNFRNNKCVISKDNGKMYIVHMGRRMIHPLRRFLKNNYEYKLEF